MNLSSRLNLLVTLVLLVILVISAVLAVNTARDNVRAEVESAMKFALPVLKKITEDLAHNSIDKKSPFYLSRLHNSRHLRVDFYDDNKYLSEQINSHKNTNEDSVQDWFRLLMYRSLGDIKPYQLPVFSNGKKLGVLVVRPQPDTEILEAWEETKTMLGMITLFFIVVTVLLYVIVAQAQKPIKQITSALSQIEVGNLNVRLPSFNLPEMNVIGEKFNLMASSLETVRKENQQLTQQIIHLQEAERKSIAQELHDEIGQHLTAVRVDACAIKRADELSRAKSSAEAIDHVVEQMIQIIRSMLQRLRPGGLDDLSFLDALHVLMSNWQERHSEIDFHYRLSGDFLLLPETVQLTLYRVIQESLTNISRHAQAKQVNVELIEQVTTIKLIISDDGCGFDLAESFYGFGLAGMKERIKGLNGNFDIQTGLSQGVLLNMTIPKDEV
jgi:two-component system sensor histidine kinase UhpB